MVAVYEPGPDIDEGFMRLALEQADRAAASGDVPVGAVLVDGTGKLVALGHNRRHQDRDPTAHAEINVLKAGARALDRWRMTDETLYVTLEPCPMCAGALVNARIGRLVYGCLDAKAGAVHSLFVMGHDPRLNHRFEVTRGVLARECADRLQRFFANHRT